MWNLLSDTTDILVREFCVITSNVHVQYGNLIAEAAPL
jgi:hypothetical protein